jgi:uncharacterized iron-regulated protein
MTKFLTCSAAENQVRSGLHALAVALALLAPAGCADAPRPGTVFDVAAGRFIAPEAALQRLAGADHVLLGEQHDNPAHHALQARILGQLIAAGRRPTVVFEMLGTDQAERLARHLAGAPRDAAGLGAAVGWAGGWPDWVEYRPIAAAALDAGLGITAGNLGREQTRAIARDGDAATGLDDTLRRAMARPLPAAAEATLLDDLEASHCGQVGREHLQPMLRVQRARDASLAAAMARQPQSVLIAGAQHARRDRGVPWYLAQLAPAAKIATLAFVEADGRRDLADLPWDYVWFTEPHARGDPCAAFPSRRAGSVPTG